MRIVYVTNNYTPYSGGVVSAIDASVSYLSSQGHEVCIVTLDFLGAYHQDPPYVHRIWCPLKFRYKKNYMAIPWCPTAALKTFIRAFKPDIIHVHHPFLLGRSALCSIRSVSIPIIFTYHTLYHEYVHYIPMPSMISRWFVHKQVTSFCAKMDGVIVPSCQMKSLVAHDRVWVLPSPLHSRFIHSRSVLDCSQNNAICTLLVVSRFAKEKNIYAALDLMTLLPSNMRLILAGYGSEYDALCAYAFDQCKLDPTRVTFVYGPSKEQLVELYCCADMFIFTSTTDTQGLVMVEAMAAGTPVVALDGPGQRDIVKQGWNGFIAQSLAEMAHFIKIMVHNEALMRSLQSHAWQTAQRYRPECIGVDLVDIYQQNVDRINKNF